MIIKCKICGKEFEAKQCTQIMCSTKCREIRAAEQRKMYVENNIEEIRRRARERQHKKSKPVYCKLCGEEVESHYTATGRRSKYQYHRECLINESIMAMLRGETFGGKDNILRVASNKGFSKSDLLEIMEERGIEYKK